MGVERAVKKELVVRYVVEMSSARALKSWNVLTATDFFRQVLEKRSTALDIVELEDSFQDLASESAAETE